MSMVGVIHPAGFVSAVDGSAVASPRQEIQSFTVDSDTDIAVGDWVELDAAINKVMKAGASTTGCIVGVALEAISSNANGQFIRVVTGGYCAAAKCEAGINAAGLTIGISSTAGSGTVYSEATAVTRPIGYSLGAVSGGLAAVCVVKAF